MVLLWALLILLLNSIVPPKMKIIYVWIGTFSMDQSVVSVHSAWDQNVVSASVELP